MNMQTILKTLSELASIYPDYPGTIERDGMGEIVRLRYFAKPCEMMIEEKRLEWNRAVRDLEDIAPRILAILQGEGQTITQAETDGASVMYHFLKDDWKPNRGSINSITNAFRMISNRIVMSTGTKTGGPPIDIGPILLARFHTIWKQRKNHDHQWVADKMADKTTEDEWERYRVAKNIKSTRTIVAYFKKLSESWNTDPSRISNLK